MMSLDRVAAMEPTIRATVDDLLSGVADGRYRSYGQLVAGR